MKSIGRSVGAGMCSHGTCIIGTGPRGRAVVVSEGHQRALLDVKRLRGTLLFVILFVAWHIADCFCYLGGGHGEICDPTD